MYFSLKERKDNVPSIEEIVPRPLLDAVIDGKWVPPLEFINVQNTKGIPPLEFINLNCTNGVCL